MSVRSSKMVCVIGKSKNLYHSTSRSLRPYRMSVISMSWSSNGYRSKKHFTAQSGCPVGFSTENASHISSTDPKGNTVDAKTPEYSIGVKAGY